MPALCWTHVFFFCSASPWLSWIFENSFMLSIRCSEQVWVEKPAWPFHSKYVWLGMSRPAVSARDMSDIYRYLGSNQNIGTRLFHRYLLISTDPQLILLSSATARRKSQGQKGVCMATKRQLVPPCVPKTSSAMATKMSVEAP